MAIDYRKKNKWPDGYYSRVGKRCGEIRDKDPKIDGDTAYKMAQNEIDSQIANENPQQQLTLV